MKDFPTQLVENYCRNTDPKGAKTIWCYTTDPNKRWEYCEPMPSAEDVERRQAEDAIKIAKMEAEAEVIRLMKKQEAEMLLKLKMEKKLAAEAERLAKMQEEARAAKIAAELQAKAEAAKLAKEEQARKEAREAAEARAKAEADAKAKAAAEKEAARLKKLEEAAKKAKEEAEKLAEAEAERLAKIEADAKAAREAAEKKSKEEAERLAKEAEELRLAKVAADLKAKEEADKLAKMEAEKGTDGLEQCSGPKCNGYRGKQSTTKSGRQCQAWTKQGPHQHSNTPEKKPSAGLIDNLCRNPDGEATIWCYTTDSKKRWEYCDPIKAAASEGAVEECAGKKCDGYRGVQTTTRKGHQCQAWNVDTPQKRYKNYKPEGNPELIANYCRNPKASAKTIWCYTMNPKVRWDYCDPVKIVETPKIIETTFGPEECNGDKCGAYRGR